MSIIILHTKFLATITRPHEYVLSTFETKKDAADWVDELQGTCEKILCVLEGKEIGWGLLRE